MLSYEIRVAMRAYLDGRRTLDEVEDMIVSGAWDAVQRGDFAGAALAGAFTAALAEHDRGDLTEAELRARLSALVPEWAAGPLPVERSMAETRRAAWNFGGVVLQGGAGYVLDVTTVAAGVDAAVDTESEAVPA
jgi:hypothetical protein